MTIRDESTRTLADALGYGDPVVAAEMATGILAASPTLAADLDLATAWRMAVEALPEGTMGPSLMHYEDYTGKRSWIAEWYAEDGARPVRAWADTPTEALVALTAALRERAR